MTKSSIIGMSPDELKALNPDNFKRHFTREELLYLVGVTGNFLKLPAAPPLGEPGPVPKYHIKLKSGWCSNGFINWKVFLKEYPGCRQIIARQIAGFLRENFKTGCAGSSAVPDVIVGVPDAATELGREVARYLGIPFLEIKKEQEIHEGQKAKRMYIEDSDMEWLSKLHAGFRMLIIEDLCTKGTGVSELIRLITSKVPNAGFVPYIMYIVNRGALEEITVKISDEKTVSCRIVPMARERIDEFEPGKDTCPYCFNGSEPIKAKDPASNWELLSRMEMINA